MRQFSSHSALSNAYETVLSLGAQPPMPSQKGKISKFLRQRLASCILGVVFWLLPGTHACATLANAGVSGTQEWPSPASNAVLVTTTVSDGQASITDYSGTGFDLVVQNNGSTTGNGASIRSNIQILSSNGGFTRFLGTTPGTISYAEIRANQGVFDLTSIKLGSNDSSSSTVYPLTFTIIPLGAGFVPITAAAATSPAQAAVLSSSINNWVTFTPTGSTQIANFTGIYGVRIIQSSGIQVNCDAITVNNPRLASSPPTVTTPTSASITGTGATLGGNVTSDGGATITERGVVYAVTSTNSNPQISGTGVTKVSTTGTTGVFTLASGTLTPGSAYSFAAYATNSSGTSYSSVGTFTTLSNNADLSALSFSAGTISFSAGTTSYSFNVPNATANTTVTASRSEANAVLQVQLNAGGFTSLTSGAASGSLSLNVGANTVDVKVTVQDGTTTKTYTTTITRAAALSPPTVTSPTSASITGTSATLGGNVTSDGGATITERGVVYSVTSINNNPQIGGTGVTKVITTGTTGVFTVSSGTLTPGTQYSFAAYATNSVGTTYATPVSTFTTLSNNANLSNLVVNTATFTPTFSSSVTSYTSEVPRSVASVSVTPTAAQANAVINARLNGGTYAPVTSGSASGSLALNLGNNTIDVQVTAQDGTTQKTYSVAVKRLTYLEAWRRLHFNTLTSTGNAADNFTPQNDGLPNLLKFATAMNPEVNGVSPTGIVKNGSTLEFTYPRSLEAKVECTFIVEWSETLQAGSWSAVDVSEQVLSTTSTLEQVKASLPAGSLGRRFVRLRVTNP